MTTRAVLDGAHFVVNGQKVWTAPVLCVVLGSELDDVDLYRPIVEMYMSAIKLS